MKGGFKHEVQRALKIDQALIGFYSFLMGFRKRIYKTANSTLHPTREAKVISISKLNFSNLPFNKSLTLLCATPKCSAACDCVQPSVWTI